MNPFGPGPSPDDEDGDRIAAEMERRGFHWDAAENLWWNDDEQRVVEDAADYLRGFEED